MDETKLHLPFKGCMIVMQKRGNALDGAVDGKYCVTHKKQLGKQGWELHWYGGTYSPLNHFSSKITREKRYEQWKKTKGLELQVVE